MPCESTLTGAVGGHGTDAKCLYTGEDDNGQRADRVQMPSCYKK
jgi:hypothetical protein